jgi:amidase
MTDPTTTDDALRPAVHTYDDDDLARLDAVATIDALDNRELSIREVVDAAIARAELVGPTLGAVAFERYAAARATLPRVRVRRGGFEGVPTFIKDMVPVAGLPLTWGSAALAGGPPQRRTKGIGRDIEAMGMAIIGSSTMPEWGFTPSTEFPHADPTRNPWNLERSVGGSSGGAAALVAAGVVPVAHAADGGGSIRIPAGCAGLVGLKPTLGRLRPHADESKLPVAVTVDGIVTRTVRDTARWYAEMERVFRSRTLPPVGEVVGPPSRRLRIGLLANLPAIADPDEPTRATVAATAARLEALGHHVEEATPPVDPEQFRDDFILYFQFLVFMAVRTARLTHGSHVRIGEITSFTNGMAHAFRQSPYRLVAATRRLRRSRAKVAEMHQRYDVLLSPVVSHLPPPLGQLSTAVEYETLLGRMVPWIAFTPIANAAGTPSISLPMGFDAATNLPVAAMLSADFGEDALLLQLALELEAAHPWALSTMR